VLDGAVKGSYAIGLYLVEHLVQAGIDQRKRQFVPGQVALRQLPVCLCNPHDLDVAIMRPRQNGTRVPMREPRNSYTEWFLIGLCHNAYSSDYHQQATKDVS
jgi:hypothetical protein